MTIFVLFMLAFAPTPEPGTQPAAPASLEQLKADSNPEHRAHTAIDYAMAAERNAETAYSKPDPVAFTGSLQEMQAALELAQTSLVAAGKSPYRSPKHYKYGEQKSRELVKRLEDLEQKLDLEERKALQGPKTKVTEIHDVWLEGIMSRKK